MNWDVVMAELAEQYLPCPQVHGSIPVIGEFLLGTFIYCQLYWKDKKRRKSRQLPIKNEQKLHGGSQMVSVLASYSTDPSSNPGESTVFFCKIVWKGRK